MPDPRKICFLTQTTLSLDETRDIVAALKSRFPGIKVAAGVRTSATRPRTVNRGKSRRAASQICYWSSVRGTARTPSAWWKSASKPAFPRT